MRDQWTHIVSARLAGLELPDDERDEVIEEVAAHLRECADEIEAAGVTDVTDRTLAQVSDWPKLASQIRRAKEPRMSATGVDLPYRKSPARSRWALAAMMAVTVLVGAVAGFLTVTLTPARYRSQALIQVVPPKVSSSYIRVATPRSLDARVRSIQMTLLGRTRLERLIQEFDLYHSERVSRLMEDVVSQFRDNISIQVEVPAVSSTPATIISVSYTGRSPSAVMKVTERLAGWVKDEDLKETSMLAEGTKSFLESQAEDVGRRLQEHQARIAATHAPVDRRSQMETQVLESSLLKLLTDLEAARMQQLLEFRQIGEQLNLIEPARLPERAIGPTRAQYTGFGALAGLSMGVLIALGVAISRLWSSSRPQPLTQTA